MILRTIHVGVTGRGETLLETIGRDSNYKPVAIVETNTTAAKVAQYKLKSVRPDPVPIFSGLTGALSQIEADALVITAPAKMHAELCRMAFTVNLHVLLERPMVPDIEVAQQLHGESEAAWCKFVVVQPMRYQPVQQTITHLLKTPDHPHYPGEVKMVDLILHRYRPASDAEYPFFIAWERFIDYADTLLAWFGKARRATARQWAVPWTQHIQDANLQATLEYDGGPIVNAWLSDDAFAGVDRLVLQGERGWLVVTDGANLRFYPCPGEDGTPTQGEAVELLDSPAPEQQIAGEFFRYVLADDEPPTSSRRNLRALTTCELIARSIKARRPVERAELGM